MSEHTPNGSEHEVRNAWEDVSERLTGWGRLVASRYKTAAPAETATATATSDQKRDAAHDLGDQLNRAFTALGDTLRDEAAKQELHGAMKAFGDAVSLTVNETAEQIRRRVGSGSTNAGSTNGGSSDGGSHDRGPGDSMPPPPA
jgi:hypothetical protein